MHMCAVAAVAVRECDLSANASVSLPRRRISGVRNGYASGC
jgi:hypothetical protein